MKKADRVVLGWREWVALPKLGVLTIKAKLDTGARTSSIHAFKMAEFQRDGVPMVRFEVHPVQRTDAASVLVEAEVRDVRVVRNSGGHSERRPVIVTDVEMNGVRWPIELTLTRRDEMGFRMLLGRQALRGRATVDPGRSFVAGGATLSRGSSKPAARKRQPKASTPSSRPPRRGSEEE